MFEVRKTETGGIITQYDENDNPIAVIEADTEQLTELINLLWELLQEK